MKRRRVLWTEVARRDLEGLVDYLAAESPRAALETLGRLERRARTLSTMAERGRVVPELGRLHVREYRELLVAPYRLVYRVTSREVLVLAVLDAGRNLEDILLDRLIRWGGGEE